MKLPNRNGVTIIQLKQINVMINHSTLKKIIAFVPVVGMISELKYETIDEHSNMAYGWSVLHIYYNIILICWFIHLL